MKIFLFDMDGVLLEPRGYHEALIETVAVVGRALGFRELAITKADIEVFEASGVTSEWDSTAICTALLMRDAWEISPDNLLPSAPPLPQLAIHDLPSPDFRGFFGSRRMAPVYGSRPTQLAEESLLSDGTAYTEAQVSALQSLLRGARSPLGSLTHLLFQELVLGSRLFQDTYGVETHLNTEGTLLTRDRPSLAPQTRNRLLAWLEVPDHHAAVFTNRPSRAPQGSTGAPEAELGLELTELEMLPLVGRGGLAWLEEQRGLAPGALLKPSATHALVALRQAIGDSLGVALQAAAALALDQEDDPGWANLEGAEITVFEDSAEGLASVAAARACLVDIGVSMQAILLGVTQSLPKRQALEAAQAEVFPSLAEALGAALA